MKKINWPGVAAIAASFFGCIGAVGGAIVAFANREAFIGVCVLALGGMAVPFIAGLWNKIGAKKDVPSE
jgi:hypothetical protein